MPDQADQLRSLVFATTFGETAPTPFWVAVVGGTHAAGTTSAAIGIALSLQREGKRVLLLDADQSNPSLAASLECHPGTTIADVCLGNQTLLEVMAEGPGGIRVIPGGFITPADLANPQGVDRLIKGLCGSGTNIDVLILDCGIGKDPLSKSLLEKSDWIISITTPEPHSFLESYTQIKQAIHISDEIGFTLVVNRVHDQPVGSQLLERAKISCRQFLDFELDSSFVVHEQSDSTANDENNATRLLFKNEAERFGSPMLPWLLPFLENKSPRLKQPPESLFVA